LELPSDDIAIGFVAVMTRDQHSVALENVDGETRCCRDDAPSLSRFHATTVLEAEESGIPFSSVAISSGLSAL
jgi:hypothetical protein